MTNKIENILCYPVKGLSAQSMDNVSLKANLGMPNDRRFALAHSSTKFDKTDPRWQPKTNFLMLLRDERLATLQTAFDASNGILSVCRNGRQIAQGNITTPVGRAIIEDFFAAYMKREATGKPRLLEMPSGHMFSDHRHCVLSLINMASVRDLERVTKASLNPIRFRANLIFESEEPWQEFTWLDQEITIANVRFKVTARINRCAATNVEPNSGMRNMNIPKSLKQGFGHVDMGVYVKVLSAGKIAVGDQIKV